MQPEKFAGGEPIFLPGLKRLLRLANHLKLIVAEKLLERSLDPGQLRRNRLRLGHVLRDHQAAPHLLRAAQARDRAHDQRDKCEQERARASHEGLFGCVIRRQRLQALSPQHSYSVLLCFEHRDRRIRANDWINAGV